MVKMATSSMVEHVIVDSGGFIRNAPIREIGENVYSVPEVVDEISDKATKERLQFLPYTLNLKSPSSEAVLYVSDFAKKTGDYKHLSKTDIIVLALTYMLEKQHVGEDHIRKEPLKKPAEYVVPNKSTGGLHMAGFYLGPEGHQKNQEKPDGSPGEASEAVTDTPETGDAVTDTPETGDAVTDTPETGDAVPESLLEEEEEDMDGDEEEDDDDADDDDGWITPSNIKQVKQRMGLGTAAAEKTHVCVACITSDFAMQNVLIQMGLNVVSVDGLLIKQARTYVMRCFACTKITYDTLKTFCPNCGNKTLKRVAMMRDAEGKMHFFFSRRPLNTRGMKYPLPQPKGGKYANNPVLCEDQPLPHQRPRKSKQTDFLSDYVVGASPFAAHDISSRAATIGVSKKHDFHNAAYWNKRNPNEPRRRLGRKK